VRDGDAIALDASTTAWQVARHLKDRRELTVVTNGLFIALEFVDSPGVTVVMPGGTLRAASASLVGDEGTCILERYHVQKGFFSAGGFTLEEGLTDTSQYEVDLKQRMVERSKSVVALVDSSKWGQVSFASLASVAQLDHVITDDSAPPEMVAALRQQGIEVTLVSDDRRRTKAMERFAELETRLNSYDSSVRSEALRKLALHVEREETRLGPETDVVNMHLHTFYSFNALGHSPVSLAWLAKQQGFRAAGIVDFDVLKGVDEFLGACETMGVRGSTGIESRVFVPEYGAQEINSPGEPGICYHMGIGFTSSQVPDAGAAILAGLDQRAEERNRAILARGNAHLDPVTVDYEIDVLPLTPAGNPTERHMVLAYVQAAQRAIPDQAAFWAGKLGVAPDEISAIMNDSAAFQNLIRAKLIKRGGVGYVQPDSGMFPTLESLHELIVACGALPCCAWLDGTTVTEEAMEEWLGFLIDKGVVALNIIPDRNWNFPDPETRRLKVQNLYRVVELARELDLPLNIGTELNSFGQKLVDDFDAPELTPVRQPFVDGAYFIYGHTVLQRALGLGYQSEWAAVYLPTRGERNGFYLQAGRLIPPGRAGLDRLGQLDPAQDPAGILTDLRC